MLISPPTIERKAFTGLEQIAWDSTSLSTFMTCPKKYQLSILEGWQPKRESHHLRFGIAFHKAMEIYERTHEQPYKVRLYAALRAAMEVCVEPDGSIWETGCTSKSVPNLLRTVIWCLDDKQSHKNINTLLIDGKPLVEYSFRFPMNDIYYCGHLDNVVEFNGDTFVVDYKTTKSYLDSKFFNNFNPNIQMTGYTYAGKIVLNKPVAGVIIEAAQILVSGSRFARGYSMRNVSDLEAFEDDVFFYTSLARNMAKAEKFPMNPTACGNYGGCQFREVCTAPPEFRLMFLNTHFTKRYWDPLETREV